MITSICAIAIVRRKEMEVHLLKLRYSAARFPCCAVRDKESTALGRSTIPNMTSTIGTTLMVTRPLFSVSTPIDKSKSTAKMREALNAIVNAESFAKD